MLTKAMQDAINEQIKNELYSAYLYLAMSNQLEEKNLGGFANWLQVQFHEEQGHALKFMEYLHDRGGKVELKAIDQPPAMWSTNLEVFQQVLEHEKKVTNLIHKLYALALKENDYATQLMLQWFISEQVEEEKNASDIIAQLEMITAHDTAVLMLDHDLGKRKLGGD
jgi:ferritin